MELTPVAAAVSALPALPPPTPGERYGPVALTAAWLSDYRPHTQRAYFRDLAHYLAWCQREQLDPRTARPADLSRYRTVLAGDLSATSLHRRLSALSSWYAYLAANGDHHVTSNPLTGFRRPRADRDASTTAGLSADQVRALLAAADTHARHREAELTRGHTPARRTRHLAALRDRALLRLLADLGLRIGEALALDVPALSHNQGRRTLRYQAKGGRWRERPLTPPAAAALADYLAVRAAATATPPSALTGPLLATTGRGGGTGRLDEPAAFRLIRRLARQAGITSAERLSPHSLRHAFATNARDLGLSLEDVQDAMGHADPRTTRRYDRARFALHRDPALRLADLYTDDAPPDDAAPAPAPAPRHPPGQ